MMFAELRGLGMWLLAALFISLPDATQEAAMAWNQLTPEESRVIEQKGTEPPFSGEYYAFHGDGVYHCRRCNAPLYRSQAKFDSGCGWPSFDEELPGAVLRLPDADGARTEILCASCGAHLGHVFLGERLTAKDTRHCVNSLSLVFVPKEHSATEEQAIFAGGCFWGVEYFFQQAPGVLRTRVGYTGGQKEHPTYHEVCGGTTGHAEAVELTFDPSQTSFEALARLFFEIHDPTQSNRQGPDIGEQYRSAIFYCSEPQRRTAEQLIRQLRAKGNQVVTQVLPAGPFWPAEAYHQDYYQKSGQQPYCHFRTPRF